MLARIVGKPDEGRALVDGLRRGLEEIAAAAMKFPRRPRVYFEEWDEPLISGIEWVEELIEIAGGEPIFPELRGCGKAKDRVVDPAIVAARDPEVILASWCGKKVRKETICSRPGWDGISAVRHGHVYEIRFDDHPAAGAGVADEGVRHDSFDLLAGVVVTAKSLLSVGSPQRRSNRRSFTFTSTDWPSNPPRSTVRTAGFSQDDSAVCRNTSGKIEEEEGVS